MAIANHQGDKPMSDNYKFIPANPSFTIKYPLYMKIIDSIPFGKLSTLTAINTFISDVYGVSNIRIPDPDPQTRLSETLAGVTHAWWRVVSDMGLIQDWNIPIGMDARKDLLEKEGHTVILSKTGVSYKVINYKESMFDLNILRPIMPPIEEAAERIF